jgi:hypothetical protein
LPRFGGFLVLALWCLSTSSVLAQVREQRPNFVGGEVLGRGLLATINYERWLSNQVGLGAGLMAIGTNDGAAVVLPLYVSYATGDVHSFYVSAGTTYAGGGDVHEYDDLWLVTISAGYQFHSYGGFYVRPLFTLFLPTNGGEGFLVWPGIALGGSF